MMIWPIVVGAAARWRTPLDRLVEDGFETLTHHNDTAVKIIELIEGHERHPGLSTIPED